MTAEPGRVELFPTYGARLLAEAALATAGILCAVVAFMFINSLTAK